MISLVGSLSSSAVAIIFPPLVHMVTMARPPGPGLCWVVVVKDVLVMIFGIVGFLVGTVTSIVDIVRAFSTG